MKLTIIVPANAVKMLVRKYRYVKVEMTKLRCVELVHEEMQRIIQHCGNEVQQEMLRFVCNVYECLSVCVYV